MATVIQFLTKGPGKFASSERPGALATNSEVRRWIAQGAVLFNGEKVTVDEAVDFPIISVVLHPKNDHHRVTYW